MLDPGNTPNVSDVDDDADTLSDEEADEKRSDNEKREKNRPDFFYIWNLW